MTANPTTLTPAWQLAYTSSGAKTVIISNPSSGVAMWSKTLTGSAPTEDPEDTNVIAPRASISVSLVDTERVYAAGVPGSRINVED